MFFRSEPSWWIVLLLGQTLSKKYGHKKNKNIYSVSKQGSTKRKWPEFQLVLWKSSYVALSFCFPMATYVPLRYLPSKELFLSHTIPVLRCTDGDQNDVLLLPDYSGIGSLWCFLGYSTFNPFFFFFFTFFARLGSPCKLCLSSHTLTTVSMKRRRYISLTNYSHGKGLKPPISSDSFCSEVAEAVLISVLDAKKTTDCGP